MRENLWERERPVGSHASSIKKTNRANKRRGRKQVLGQGTGKKNSNFAEGSTLGKRNPKERGRGVEVSGEAGRFDEEC